MLQAAQGEAEGRIQELTAQLQQAQAAPPTGTPSPSPAHIVSPTALVVVSQLLQAVPAALFCSRHCHQC